MFQDEIFFNQKQKQKLKETWLKGLNVFFEIVFPNKKWKLNFVFTIESARVHVCHIKIFFRFYFFQSINSLKIFISFKSVSFFNFLKMSYFRCVICVISSWSSYFDRSVGGKNKQEKKQKKFFGTKTFTFKAKEIQYILFIYGLFMGTHTLITIFFFLKIRASSSDPRFPLFCHCFFFCDQYCW